MIKSIVPKPIGKRQYVDGWNVPHLQYEFLVMLEDDTECTIWISSEEVSSFIKGKWNRK